MDIKIEGINGQLPNLDLVTLAFKICHKEGIEATFKHRYSHVDYEIYNHWLYSLKTMLLMILTQFSGRPTGNHGYFLPYGIQALTLNGQRKFDTNRNVIGLLEIGRIVESMIRSVNNLLERFHQSYFFYFLISTDRFVSIIYFSPVLAALVGALLVKTIAIWYKISSRPVIFSKNQSNNEQETLDESPKQNVSPDIVKILMVYLGSHSFGLVLNYSYPFFASIGLKYGYELKHSIFFGFLGATVLFFILLKLFQLRSYQSIEVLNMLVLCEIGVAILGIGMINISLGIILGAIYIPPTLFVSVTQKRVHACLNYIVWFLAHPLMVLFLFSMVYQFLFFLNESFDELFIKTFEIACDVLHAPILDSIIFGNCLFDVGCLIFFPTWLIMSCVTVSCPYTQEDVKKIEKKEKIE